MTIPPPASLNVFVTYITWLLHTMAYVAAKALMSENIGQFWYKVLSTAHTDAARGMSVLL